MTSLHRPQPKQTSAAAKYGPIVAIVAVIAVIAAVSLSKRGSSETAGSTSGTAGGSGGSIAKSADLPPLFADVKKAGGDLAQFGDRCDATTGKLKIPTVYAAPCVPVFKGDNGGATSAGVTKDTIKIVEYIPSTNGDLSALLQGLLATPEQTAATNRAYVKMFSELYETYGRKVEWIPFQSTGAADDEVIAKADAIKIAEELEAFAVIGGPALTQSYAEELAARKVICIGCGQGTPDATHQKLAPYLWGALATPEQFLINLGDLITKQLNGKKAEFAGDAELQQKNRVFGVVHFEQKVPVYKELEEQVAAAGNQRGYETAATETYVLDLPKMQERATTIIAKMKSAGVTTVIFLGDPIMPMMLTKASTEQGYFPEWIVTGTVLTDTNTFGRRYDQEQWKHAFGISSLPVKTPREVGDAWQLHQWFYGADPAAATTAPIIYQGIQLVFLGIHLAGPKLTPETFRDGLFNMPPVGGGPTTPHISFGEHGYFMNELTKTSPPDYLGVDDVALIWWDTEAEGPDESGSVAKGMYRYIDNGKRFMPHEIEAGDFPRGKVDNTVTILNQPPPEDTAPSYPRETSPLP